jgi:SAM-dependent methyltransferase
VDLKLLGHNWNRLGETDPMWAILMAPDRSENRWDQAEFFETGHHDVSYALQTVRELRFPLRRGKALDFGCGLGRLSQALACYFDEVSGVDIAPAMIRKARGYNAYADRCRFYVNERDDLELFSDNQFDFILSLIVLQHMRPDYAKKYIAEFLRLLAPGGLLLFQEPSHTCRRAMSPNYRPLGYRVRQKAKKLLQKASRRFAESREVLGPSGFNFSEITDYRHERCAPILDWEGSYVRIDRAESPGPNGHPVQDSQPAKAVAPPKTEVHTIPRREMLTHLKRHGGRVIHVEPRNECSPHHASFRYFVTK